MTFLAKEPAQECAEERNNSKQSPKPATAAHPCAQREAPDPEHDRGEVREWGPWWDTRKKCKAANLKKESEPKHKGASILQSTNAEPEFSSCFSI
jgi:hypothetical protein